MSSTNIDSRALIPKSWEVNDLAEAGDKFTAVVVNSKNREQDLSAGMGQFSQGDKLTIDI